MRKNYYRTLPEMLRKTYFGPFVLGVVNDMVCISGTPRFEGDFTPPFYVCLNGNSKQRRQQRRKLLREANRA